MTVIINGTDNSASTPAVTGTDGDTGMFYPAANTVALSTGGSERMRVDSSGNVGIGTTSPSGRLNLATGASATCELRLTSNNTGSGSGDRGRLNFYSADNSGVAYQLGFVDFDRADGTGTASYMAIQTRVGGTVAERARINSAGYFKASNTGSYVSSGGGFHELVSNAVDENAVYIINSSASPYTCQITYTTVTPNNTTNTFVYCSDSTNVKAIIYSNGSFQSRANSYGGISDVKLKQDIVDAGSQWDDIKGLRVRKFRMKDEVAADPNYPAHLGLIAQEAELVSPGLVFESPDFEEVEVTDEEGNVTKQRNDLGTTTKSVKYSVLYMKAVKALQEAMERIETLEAKVAALEGAE